MKKNIVLFLVCLPFVFRCQSFSLGAHGGVYFIDFGDNQKGKLPLFGGNLNYDKHLFCSELHFNYCDLNSVGNSKLRELGLGIGLTTPTRYPLSGFVRIGAYLSNYKITNDKVFPQPISYEPNLYLKTGVNINHPKISRIILKVSCEVNMITYSFDEKHSTSGDALKVTMGINYILWSSKEQLTNGLSGAKTIIRE
ncbi:MAG: hypothetical protein H0W61_11170 [Bacteroidetes bacterium]|nr:hypothetical protein [Bacteroidota bacterium]